MWILTYFAFTTLSTVGFGDYHPRSDRERLVIVVIFLVGVNLTSFVMDTLNKVLKQLGSFNNDHDESDGLSLFFKILQRFNHEVALDRLWVEDM